MSVASSLDYRDDMMDDPECCHCASMSVRSASPAPSLYSFSSSRDGHMLKECHGRVLNSLCEVPPLSPLSLLHSFPHRPTCYPPTKKNTSMPHSSFTPFPPILIPLPDIRIAFTQCGNAISTAVFASTRSLWRTSWQVVPPVPPMSAENPFSIWALGAAHGKPFRLSYSPRSHALQAPGYSYKVSLGRLYWSRPHSSG
jgi:hypothetical protein